MTATTPHRILTTLSDGPRYVENLRDIAGIRDLNRALASLSADHLIEVTKAGYQITEAGRGKLAGHSSGDAQGLSHLPSGKHVGNSAP